MSLQKDILDLLERSVIHAKAEEQNAVHLKRLRALHRQPGNWSTIGEYNVPLDKMPQGLQKQLQRGHQIGSIGGFGIVRRIEYCGVPLAKKSLSQYRLELQSIKNEVDIIAKLDNHRHIIKLVGTYESIENGDRLLNILTYPVAICDLDKLLDDCQALGNFTARDMHHKGDLSIGDLCNISIRAMGLGSYSTASPEEILGAIRERLSRTMGCITKAVKWIHSQDVQHRDLKPHNILLRSRTIYLTDFGISRSAQNTTTQSYSGYTPGYAAPETSAAEEVNPVEADVYSLGCIFVHILTVISRRSMETANRAACMAVLKGMGSGREEAIRQYLKHNLRLPKDEQAAELQREWPSRLFKTFTIQMIMPLLSNERQKRPGIVSIDEMLWRAGGDDHEYHGRCCHPSIGAEVSS